jgi:hypothetical protein
VRLRRRETAARADDVPPTRGRAGRAVKADAPRAWNLWELERLAQELNGDPRAEERRLLLLHLRDVADTSGHLPVEFDALVRDAFGARLAELDT